MKEAIIQKIKSAPIEPGVYIFRQGKDVLYIGKAANLKNRLKSYLKITDLKTQSLHEEADGLEYTVLRSDIEALIEESRLIKSLKPKYNVLWMDDKTYHYVYFTKEFFPKVFISHANPSRYSLVASRYSKIGPFTDGNALRVVMKLLRRSFPYCTCLRQGYGKASLSSHSHLRDCLNAQIGKCLGFCCLAARDPAKRDKKIDYEITKTHNQYKKNIRAIKNILNGKRPSFTKNYGGHGEKERWALEKIFEHREFLNTYNVKPSKLDIEKIECYDNSNFAGKEAVGAMTVLTRTNDQGLTTNDWVADKSQWRKFKIKNTPTRDDPRMTGEVLRRRLNHPEWPYPDLIVIDGGITQYRAAKRVIDSFDQRLTTRFAKATARRANDEQPTKKIQLVSYAKPQRKVIGMADAPKELQELIERIIYQTHNFVIRYHRQVRSKEFIPR